MKSLAAGILPIFLVAFPATAGARTRPARCDISTEEAPYRGPCRFLAERNGSFSMTPAGRRFFFGGVSAISVAVVQPGQAEVSGLTAAGINSRWGSARRSRRDPACWVGQDFTICVR
ncbi:MAG: hypothetical protein QOH04_2026 [Sphingomonadales bacterium]|nr:hypothetical protein [Sphingomonadales bacterium]